MASRRTKKTRKTLLTFTTELFKKLDSKAKETFGDRQGYLSMYVEMVLRNHLGLSQPNVEDT